MVPAVGPGEEGVSPLPSEIWDGQDQQHRGIVASAGLNHPGEWVAQASVVKAVELGEDVAQAFIAGVLCGDAGGDVVHANHAVLSVIELVFDKVCCRKGTKVMGKSVRSWTGGCIVRRRRSQGAADREQRR